MNPIRKIPGPPCITCPMLYQDVNFTNPRKSTYRCIYTAKWARYIGRMYNGLKLNYRPKWCPEMKG